MNSGFTVFIFFLMTRTLQAQNEEKKYEMERLIRHKNHITQILTYEFNLATNDSSLVERDSYDHAGNLTERQQFDYAGEMQFKGVTSYNEKGLIREEAGYNATGRLMQYFVYDYDKVGNQTDYQQLTETRKVLTSQKAKFNERGQRVRLYTQLDNQKNYYLSVSFAYDKDGNQTSSTMYTADGDTGSLSEYTYNANHQLTAVYEVVNREKKLYATYHYNNRQQLVEERYYQKNKHIADGRPALIPADRVKRFVYDKEGNTIEESTWNKEIPVKRIRYYFVKKAP